MGDGIDPGPIRATLHNLGVTVDRVNINRRGDDDGKPIEIYFQATREQYELAKAALPEVEFPDAADAELDS